MPDINPDTLNNAIAWAERAAELAVARGIPLSDDLAALARQVGVSAPERIRLVELDTLPRPDTEELQLLCEEVGMFGPDMAGLTLGYAVLILRGHANTRLLSHEFRHVYQVEQAGSLKAFLETYIVEVVTHGYRASPLEQDARANEIA
jgi:hypothetical protein